MKTFYVEIDTNDADYIGKLVKVEDEVAEKWMPLIEKIKNFKPYSVVSKYDENPFIIVADSSEVLGQGFKSHNDTLWDLKVRSNSE